MNIKKLFDLSGRVAIVTGRSVYIIQIRVLVLVCKLFELISS